MVGTESPFEVECVGYYPREVLFEEEWTPSVDVYALGMMLIHFITQQKPFFYGCRLMF